MGTFNDLKKSRSKHLENLTKELAALDTKKSFNNDDDRMWKLTVDKAGSGHAVIRFLPKVDGEEIPWVRIWDHGFQGPNGGWYIEKSLTTLDKPDPVSEHNTKLWNSGIDAQKELARKQKRRLSYYSNIYVVSDPANPENEGKVFIFKYGQKIFDKIKNLMSPEFEEDEAVDPFDLWEGANFKIRAKQVAGFRNYDSSEFSAPTPLGADDDEREKIWNSQYSLQALIAPNEFKSYEELSARLNTVLGLSESGQTEDAPALGRIKEENSFPTAEATLAGQDDDDEEEGLNYFRDLASGND